MQSQAPKDFDYTSIRISIIQTQVQELKKIEELVELHRRQSDIIQRYVLLRVPVKPEILHFVLHSQNESILVEQLNMHTTEDLRQILVFSEIESNELKTKYNLGWDELMLQMTPIEQQTFSLLRVRL